MKTRGKVSSQPDARVMRFGFPCQTSQSTTARDNNNMLSKLLVEHDHIQKTLNLLEIQFLDLCRDRVPDYAIMLSIVVYIQEYPEQAHHPLEDAVFSLLLRRGGEEGRLARELIKDHTELELITRALRDSLELITRGIACDSDLLKARLADFISRQRRHLHAEEMRVYPLLKTLVTDQEWATVAAMVPPMNDPVFGDRTRNDYERLYREIEGKNR